MKSVKKAIEVLEVLAKTENGIGITQLSRELNLPKSTIHQILSTLKSVRFAEQNPEDKKYHLGLRIFELGNIVQSQLQLRKIAYSYLYNLSRKINETTYLVVLEGSRIVYIDCVESTARLRAHPLFGDRVPLHCTGVGKAIMAFLPEEKVNEIIHEDGLERFTENTITDSQVLKRELKEIRKRGYAIDNMEHEQGIRCVGAPIRNHRKEVFAAISVSGPSQRFDPPRIPAMAKLVIQTAEDISRKMGYRKQNMSEA
ncbi:MAG: IclR family transcriptional regulator [Candidatus Aerophobus sp.]|nr:MAG: IclR family transcriptional regulator [Candidatus Aerophobus sp.]